MVLLSVVAAVVACLGYGFGSVLQSIGARRPAGATGPTAFLAIMIQPMYLAGLLADGLGFVGNVVAARQLPLFLVQAVMTGSVAVTAVIAALRGARLGRRDWIALGVLAAGLVLLAVTARAGSAPAPSTGWRVLILAAAGLSALVGLAGRRGAGRSWMAAAAASGVGFAMVAVAARGLSSVRYDWRLLADPLLWAVLAGGAVGMIFFALALQRGPVTAVTAVVFMLEMIIPAVVGVLLFGDRVGAGLWPVAGAGFALAVLGVASLARFAAD